MSSTVLFLPASMCTNYRRVQCACPQHSYAGAHPSIVLFHIQANIWLYPLWLHMRPVLDIFLSQLLLEIHLQTVGVSTCDHTKCCPQTFCPSSHPNMSNVHVHVQCVHCACPMYMCPVYHSPSLASASLSTFLSSPYHIYSTSEYFAGVRNFFLELGEYHNQKF